MIRFALLWAESGRVLWSWYVAQGAPRFRFTDRDYGTIWGMTPLHAAHNRIHDLHDTYSIRYLTHPCF